MQNHNCFFDDEVMLKLKRDRFLVGLVSKEPQHMHHVKEMLDYLKLNPFFTFPAIALMEPILVFRNECEKRNLLESLRDYLQQHEMGESAVFMDGEGRLGILFSWVSKDWIAKMQRQVKDAFAITVNMGVGKPCGQLSDIHTSYHQALQALQDKFYKGIGEIVYYSELAKYQKISVYPTEQEKQLFEQLKYAGNAEAIRKSVDDFYRCILQHGPVASKSIYELTIRLLIGLEKRSSASESVSALNRCEIMSVVEMKTIQEVKAFVCEHLTGLREAMLQYDKESHRSIIKKTIQYMEQECQHATLYSVAQKVYMTPTYLSSLFKSNTGKTFIDQLTDIRINKAKDMLKSTHLKNYEVAEKVGYKDSRYFSQIFKKKVGVSPSEYRDSTGL